MSDTTDVVVRATPTFVNIPAEVRGKIILYLVKMKRDDSSTNATLDTSIVPYTYDFSVNATSIRCHTMDSFPLLFINRLLYQDCIPIIYKYCSVVMIAEVTHGIASFGFIPSLLQRIPSAIKANTQVVGVKIFGLVAPHLKFEYPTPRMDCEEAGRKKLSMLIDTIMNEFTNRRALHICVGLDGPKVDDLKILYKLFSIKDTIISFEEVTTFGITIPLKSRVTPKPVLIAACEKDRRKHENRSVIAAAALGQDWIHLAKDPSLVEDTNAVCCSDISFGMMCVADLELVTPDPDREIIAWGRRRVWKRELAAVSTPGMGEYLEERVRSLAGDDKLHEEVGKLAIGGS